MCEKPKKWKMPRRQHYGLRVIFAVLLGYYSLALVSGTFSRLLETGDSSLTADPDEEHSLYTGRHLLWSRNCTPPAIEQFPRPIISQNARSSGGIIVHILVTVYMFAGLAIVCDEYFVPALDRICEVCQLTPDVAGATFMAAGSSAPELATALIGVFVAQDDIGVSGVIGSAVFNIMFVISICALFAGAVCYLNWWPLVRDCFCYMVSILALLGTIADETVTWYESIILLLLYFLYCVMMYHNPKLQAWAKTLPVPCSLPAETEESALVSYKHLRDDEAAAAGAALVGGGNHVTSQQQGYYTEEKTEINMPNHDGFTTPTGNNGEAYQTQPSAPAAKTEHIAINPFEKPEKMTERVMWAIKLPLVAASYYTMPDCRLEKYRSWYVITFTMSLVWISLFSYVMVWMITIIGFTLGIPDTVMGLTFVAAGVSVPDAFTSLAVVKEGHGDMAVSNAIGSNVFDILICLGFPWFLRTAITQPGSTVAVASKGLVYSTFSLLSTVAFLLIATHLNGWKLDKKYGVILMIWYLVFMAFASMYELNIFGYFNPPECFSSY